MGTPTEAPGHRSLADQLRGWDDERLTRLLLARPDLATPAPHDFGQLASRATVRVSLLRALDLLDRLELHVLDAVAVVGPATREEVLAVVHADEAAAGAALDRVVDLALAWWTPTGVRALSGVAEGLALAPTWAAVSGLLPPAAEAPAADEVPALLAQLSAPARALLDHVEGSGGQATSGASRLRVTTEEAATPAEELLARRLLVSRGGSAVVLPGQVGLALRGARTTRDPVDTVPPLATAERSPALVDRTAAGAAFETVRRVELLLDHWGTDPAPALRSGGLGVRDLKATARLLHVDEPTAALLVEVAGAAGLLAQRAGGDGNALWVPTDAFDAWSTQVTATRWAALARAWLTTPRAPALVGSRDEADKPRNALAPGLTSRTVTESRAMALAALHGLEDGTVLAAGTGVPSLVSRVRWLRPRRPAAREQELADALTEAASLGLVALGGLASYAALLVAGEDPGPVLDELLPEPVDHVLVQADLTAVAPGPLESSLARRLQLLADVESRGGATTYRFTPASVRRALDVGWSAAEVHEFLGIISRTPVPQPLTYLVDDTVRTYGTVRLGHAEAFLRSDDEAALTTLVHHPKAGALGLRRIAPTVVVSDTPLDVLLPRLRELGAAPVVEAADGTVQVTRPDLLRARAPRERTTAVRSARQGAAAGAVVSAVRSGDRAGRVRTGGDAGSVGAAPASLTPSGALTALREAVEAGEAVLITYVDNQGTRSDRLVDPRSVEGGSLVAYDHRADDVRSFAVHRIHSVQAVPD